MIVVMNMVTVAEGGAEAFEAAFAARERRLSEAPGFAGFELLRRDSGGEYVVLSRWESREAFQGWLKSDLFKEAHRGDGERPVGGHGQQSEIRSYEVLEIEEPVRG